MKPCAFLLWMVLLMFACGQTHAAEDGGAQVETRGDGDTPDRIDTGHDETCVADGACPSSCEGRDPDCIDAGDGIERKIDGGAPIPDAAVRDSTVDGGRTPDAGIVEESCIADGACPLSCGKRDPDC